MEYFLLAMERKASGSTCYFEFQNGKYRGKHWLEASLYIQADRFDELGLFDLFSKVISDFNYYGPTVVHKTQWAQLLEDSAENEKWKAVISELKPWADKCFEKYACFTVCGI